MLTKNEIYDVNNALDEIIKENIDLSHFKDIFVIRRESGVDGSVKEIGDFLHHNPKDQGPSYKLAKEFCELTVKLCQSGHDELKSDWLFDKQSDLIKKLKNSLTNQRCFEQQKINKLENHSFEIMRAIIQLLDGRSYKIQSNQINSCKLSLVEKGETVSLEVIIYLNRYSHTNSMKVINGKMVWTFSGPICSSFLIAHKPGQHVAGGWRVIEDVIV